MSQGNVSEEGVIAMKHYVDKYVVCPFYSQEEQQKLRCEGFGNGTGLHITFDSIERKKEHKKKFCCDLRNHRFCPLYSVIARKYEEVP